MAGRLTLLDLYRSEFSSYTRAIFFKDLFAGLTVAAVALPLALAFGVASGATAAAGMVTAILAGIVIGGLSGAPYQISGPTGAMSAILIVLAQRYGLEGVWIAGMLSGVLLLLIGILNLGRFIAFIPAPVITGFTSGIAVIIAVGQIDNLLGIKTPGTDSALWKMVGYAQTSISPNYYAIGMGAAVMLLMILWPSRWAARFPASLLAIVLATAAEALFSLPVNTIGDIPSSILLSDRLRLSAIPWGELSDFIVPTLSIAALGGIESLLCGSVASNMTGKRLHANQELIAQGFGNILIPFFGGVPATAAIARSSVGIKAGGETRMVSIIHALTLLASMFFLAPVLSRVPLAALAGVLVVTAWRMNEWEAIHFYFSHRLPTAVTKYVVTLVATVSLDLTYAILIGFCISAALFLNQASQLSVTVSQVDPELLKKGNISVEGDVSRVRVAYLMGPLFFAAVGHFIEAFRDLGNARFLILSMRAVPLLDSSGVRAIAELQARMHSRGGRLLFAGVNPGVQAMLSRCGLLAGENADSIFWGSEEAIVSAIRLDNAGS